MMPVKFLLTDEKNRTEITRNKWQSHPNSTAKKIETKLHVFNLDTFTIDLQKKMAQSIVLWERYSVHKRKI